MTIAIVGHTERRAGSTAVSDRPAPPPSPAHVSVYTPDWLAERIVTEVITDPLHNRALDPGCGSGTFLFHAIRHYLAAADADGLSNEDAIRGATEHVIGLDLHPLAVTFARVTYLLAIGMERLAARRGPFSVRVYLGDSLLRRARRSTA